MREGVIKWEDANGREEDGKLAREKERERERSIFSAERADDTTAKDPSLSAVGSTHTTLQNSYLKFSQTNLLNFP